MIHVVATIQFYPEKLDALRSVYREFVPQFREETGCIQYQPCIDLETELANQERNRLTVTVTEVWDSYAAFQSHLTAPHVLEFRQRIQGIVNKVTVKVLDPFLLD